MSQRPADLPQVDDDRLAEIRRLLTYESSISFHSNRAHESMWAMVAEVERLRGLLAEALDGWERLARNECLHGIARACEAPGCDCVRDIDPIRREAGMS